MRHVFFSTVICSRLCHHIRLPLQTDQDISMTKLSSLSALPLLHYRESYGRPTSELHCLCIFIVTLLLDCSLLVPPSGSCSTLAVLLHRSWSFLVAPDILSSLLSSSLSSLLLLLLLLVLLHVLVFLFVAFDAWSTSPRAETRSTVYCWLQVQTGSSSNSQSCTCFRLEAKLVE